MTGGRDNDGPGVNEDGVMMDRELMQLDLEVSLYFGSRYYLMDCANK
jgi:hypothetical protein